MNPVFSARFCTGRRRRQRAERGSTLLELLIAVALFVIIGGVAFSLMNQQQNSSIGLNGQVGLNMALRNTMSMLQIDLANAGAYYYQDTNLPNGALGVTLINNVVTAGSTSCYNPATPGIYKPNCFDQLNVIYVDSTYPTVVATDPSGLNGTSNCSNTNSGIAYGQQGVTTGGTTLSYAATAASYKVGDELFLMKQDGSQYTAVVLTAVPTAVPSGSPTAVKFVFNATTSTVNSSGTTISGVNTLANDPLNISACSGTTPCLPNTVPNASIYLTNSFCGNGDYILKLAPVSYQVCSGPGSPTWPYNCNTAANSPDIADPKLMRTYQGTSSIVMEQVLGFKAGGSIWNDPDPANVDIANYNYDASSYTTTPGTSGLNAYNFTLLRSVRVSLIGRTAPDITNNSVYQNGFDGGRYQVQGSAMVVNPRNMNPESMQ